MKPPRKRAWHAWSSGKDSAWALHTARQSDEFEIVGLLTTVTEAYHRVCMHGVRLLGGRHLCGMLVGGVRRVWNELLWVEGLLAAPAGAGNC